jgi:hypothetical protein
MGRGADPSDHLQVNTLDGNDPATHSDDASQILAIDVDLGTRQR